MNLKTKGIKLTVLVLLVLSGLFTGIFVSQHLSFKKKIDASEFHGTYLENPRTVNQFTLQGTDQTTFNNKSLHGKWTLIFFGFTHCGYLCPTTMAELGKMYRILEEKGIKDLPQVVMISIDPERDSLEKLSSYVKSFNNTFSGAIGGNKAIRLMTREMGIAYVKIANKDSNELPPYDIQHSGAVMLFNPQAELNAFFTTPHHADSLAKDYMLLVS
jgi:protein SCO1/2